ncbi:molybdenum cofactor guanylyltransferase MobA [Porticoccus sp. GXU_MW_L64]
MQHNKQQLTGIILAGGQGRRMGGCDKGLLTLNGKPLVSYAADNLHPHVCTTLVNTNSGQEGYRQLGFALIDDGVYAHCGPLAGVLAGVRAATTPFVAISACDQLQLPAHIYPELLQAAQSNDRGLAVARDSTRLHPTCAVVATSAAESLEAALRRQQLRVGWWFREQGAAEVCFADVRFHNINTPQDIEQLSGHQGL